MKCRRLQPIQADSSRGGLFPERLGSFGIRRWSIGQAGPSQVSDTASRHLRLSIFPHPPVRVAGHSAHPLLRPRAMAHAANDLLRGHRDVAAVVPRSATSEMATRNKERRIRASRASSARHPSNQPLILRDGRRLLPPLN